MASASLQQRTPAWHEARRGKLTASNLGAALGLCPWTTRVQAYQRAMGLDSFVGNDATNWGTNNEPNGILAYSAHTGNVVDDTGLHVHPHLPWLAGSPDGLIGTTGLLEVKCPFWRKKDGSRMHKQVPPHYYMQVNLCLEASQREWCDFITWSPEGYKIYRITRDNDLHETLMPHYLRFFAAMQRKAKAPSPLSREDKAEIEQDVKQSMDTHINYSFWDKVDVEQAPPSPDPYGDGDDEPPTKRARPEE
jgi:putative phage-type endonuclease